VLRSLGLDITEHEFSDHHPFKAADLDCGDQRDIVMTEKDAVKCLSFASDRMWYLSVATQFQADDAARLLAKVRTRIAEI
jgi:tetraacyldisaccharide 4'-kinase